MEQDERGIFPASRLPIKNVDALDLHLIVTHYGYPYTVPVSHVYQDGKIFFHGIKTGHKIDAIRSNDKVSFCVVAQDEVIPRKRTTAFISVIAFGRARIIEDEAGLWRIATLIGKKFAESDPIDCQLEIDRVVAVGRMLCVEITIEHLTGKCGQEVLLQRKLQN